MTAATIEISLVLARAKTTEQDDEVDEKEEDRDDRTESRQGERDGLASNVHTFEKIKVRKTDSPRLASVRDECSINKISLKKVKKTTTTMMSNIRKTRGKTTSSALCTCLTFTFDIFGQGTETIDMAHSYNLSPPLPPLLLFYGSQICSRLYLILLRNQFVVFI